jgi:hypothetical protein
VLGAPPSAARDATGGESEDDSSRTENKECCRSDTIAIVSDDPVRYETQDTDYGRHVSGIPWNGGGNRQVLTTRKDGMISIWKRPQDSTSYVDTAR